MQKSNKEKNCFNNTSSGGQLPTQRTFVFTQGGFWNYLWAPLQEETRARVLLFVLHTVSKTAESGKGEAYCRLGVQSWVSKVFLLKCTKVLSTPATERKEKEFSEQQYHLLHTKLLPREAVLSPTLAAFKIQLDKAPSNLVLSDSCLCFEQDVILETSTWNIWWHWVQLDHHCAQARIWNFPLRLSL